MTPLHYLAGLAAGLAAASTLAWAFMLSPEIQRSRNSHVYIRVSLSLVAMGCAVFGIQIMGETLLPSRWGCVFLILYANLSTASALDLMIRSKRVGRMLKRLPEEPYEPGISP